MDDTLEDSQEVLPLTQADPDRRRDDADADALEELDATAEGEGSNEADPGEDEEESASNSDESESEDNVSATVRLQHEVNKPLTGCFRISGTNCVRPACSTGI